MKRIRVALTGATGFLGEATRQAFGSSGIRVVSLARRPAAGLEPCIAVDLARLDESVLVERLEGVEAVVHLASAVSFDERLDPELFDVNAIASLKLARVARRCGAQFVFSSGTFVHGRSATRPREGAPLNPDSPYAMSKWVAERLISEVHDRVAVLRLAGIFGLDGPSHLGMNRAITSAVRERRPPSVTGVGRARRNYVYVHDAADVIRWVVEGGRTGLFYVAGDDVQSMAAMAKHICEVFLKTEQPVYVGGDDTYDQIVERSAELPPARTFREALADIQARYDPRRRSE